MIYKLDPQVQSLLELPEPDQIGVIVKDIHKAVDAYTNILRWGPFEISEHTYTELIYRGRPGNFRYRIALGQMGPSLQLELIESLEGESIYSEFLQTRGEGLHHLGFLIGEVDKRIAAMKQMGVEVLQKGSRPGRLFAYMDTEPLFGIIIEFRERTD